MTFPLAVHFAEAVGARVCALPFKQFLIVKAAGGRYQFVDLTARYGHLEFGRHLVPSRPDGARA